MLSHRYTYDISQYSSDQNHTRHDVHCPLYHVHFVMYIVYIVYCVQYVAHRRNLCYFFDLLRIGENSSVDFLIRLLSLQVLSNVLYEQYYINNITTTDVGGSRPRR